jgi:hypothetical protein
LIVKQSIKACFQIEHESQTIFHHATIGNLNLIASHVSDVVNLADLEGNQEGLSKPPIWIE